MDGGEVTAAGPRRGTLPFESAAGGDLRKAEASAAMVGFAVALPAAGAAAECCELLLELKCCSSCLKRSAGLSGLPSDMPYNF